MDQGEQKEQVTSGTLPWHEWYKRNREQITKTMGAVEYSVRTGEVSAVGAKDFHAILEYISNIIDCMNEQYKVNDEFQTQIQNITKSLKELKDKFSKYEEALRYVNKFKEEKEQEEKEKEKWK